MSAADDAREELEAAAWRAASGDAHEHGAVTAVLAAADSYAEAVADERIAGRVTSRSQGRERLEEAAAEKYREAS